jgi:hypothetical protein
MTFRFEDRQVCFGLRLRLAGKIDRARCRLANHTVLEPEELPIDMKPVFRVIEMFRVGVLALEESILIAHPVESVLSILTEHRT